MHMSEEIRDANINVPRSIVSSISINGCLGICILLATLFGLKDPAAISATDTGYPLIKIFRQVVGSNRGATGMTAILISMGFAATVGFVTTSSRMIWAFARDNGLPFSTFLAKVNPRTSIPINSVLVTTVLACLTSLISLGSSVVLNNIFATAIAGFYFTYFTSVALLLWHRLKGNIHEPTEEAHHNTVVNIQSGKLTWGPWRVKGWFGTSINAFACAYMIVIVFFSLWPPTSAVTPATMNYAVVIISGVILFSIAYYWTFGRRQYEGPVVELAL